MIYLLLYTKLILFNLSLCDLCYVFWHVCK